MSTLSPPAAADIVMLGTFGVWTRGTLQSRALPFARSISCHAGLRIAIVTTPWDDPSSAGTAEWREGVRIFNTRNTAPTRAPLAVAEQLRLVARLKPAIVHVMKPKGFGGLAAQFHRLLPERCGLVVDSDDWEGDGGWNEAGGYGALSRRLFAFQESRLIRDADAVTAASTLLEERARRTRAGREEERVTYLPNGLDVAWLRQLGAARATAGPARPSLLLYSRFAEFTPGWLRQFAAALDHQIDQPLDFDLVGEADAGILAGIELQYVTPRYHGYVERERIPELLGGATVAVYPYADNLINRSKQSVKLLELMAAGVPIVACDVGDVARIAGDAVELSAATAPESIACQVQKLLNEPGRRVELGARASSRAAGFAVDRLADRLLDVYGRAGFVA